MSPSPVLDCSTPVVGLAGAADGVRGRERPATWASLLIGVGDEIRAMLLKPLTVT